MNVVESGDEYGLPTVPEQSSPEYEDHHEVADHHEVEEEEKSENS